MRKGEIKIICIEYETKANNRIKHIRKKAKETGIYFEEYFYSNNFIAYATKKKRIRKHMYI